MKILIAAEIGLVFWLVAWALGVTSIDAFMVTIVIVVIAVAVEAISRNRQRRAAENSALR